MGALIWFVIAVVLAVAELAAGEFTLLMLAGAALVTAGVSIAEIPLWAEVAAFAVSSAALLAFVRPPLKRRLTAPKALDTSVKALIGHSAEVLEAIEGRPGQIRLEGSRWSARSLDPSVNFTPGEIVTVVDIDGATAVVWKEP